MRRWNSASSKSEAADPANHLEATRDTQDAAQLDERLLVVALAKIGAWSQSNIEQRFRVAP